MNALSKFANFCKFKELLKGDVLFFVHDESANGTFIDGVKIGKLRCRVCFAFQAIDNFVS